MPDLNFALNPLQYFATADGWLDPTLAPPFEARLAHISNAGFTSVQSEVPHGQTPREYQTLLSDHGLQPGPGYVNLMWGDDSDTRAAGVDGAAKLARDAVALGNPLLFLSMGMDAQAPRVAHPAVGYAGSTAHLDRVRDYLADAASVITGEGAVAALHPHVGSWVETEAEARYVLDTIDKSILKFGPDTGHLSWVGSDPLAIITEYADRVAGVHIKDFHADIARDAVARSLSYRQTVAAGIWTEPGNGDMDTEGILGALPAAFGGWIVVEVDRGSTPTPEESINRCGEWLASQLSMQLT